ncbi:hypothetical protein Ade02nite_20040 [Paractinoplanes deccanensis]|uniref:Uncharacterized protein n=1 Tax=Paractinoplanes deccanensis TaxID=113561 RepID=A0ABQ3Y045_9ACTN|nr:hypothetical protein [Actinoplanes deccanensis]GID73363.1 hypothetical protein Ade02nite_20040 [Actinoplanes deccanensis]
MTWTNTKRVRRELRRRSDYHQERMAQAATSKQRLSAACQWLISEAWQAGRVAYAEQLVLEAINRIRKEANHHDGHQQ